MTIYIIMRKLLFFAVAFCLFLPLQAQEAYNPPKEQNPTVAIAIVPQSFANNIAELNLDIRLADRQWLTIAPLFQFGDNNDYYYEALDAIKSGIGLGLNYRYFPLTRRARPFSDGKGAFVSAGLRGLSTSYEYTGNIYTNYTDQYYNSGLIRTTAPYKEQLSQVGFDVNIGYVLRFFDILFVESYMGVGTRYSNYEYDSTKGLNLGKYTGDTGFSGYCFTGGIRFGIFLNRYTRR